MRGQKNEGNKLKWDTVLEEICEKICKMENPTKADVEDIKKEIGGKYHLSKLPRNWELLQAVNNKTQREKIRKAIGKQKPVRTVSGVAPIAVMTAPLSCPGECLYCPGGVDSDFSSPQSYTGNEPAARRAKKLNYDPFKQVKVRLNQYEALGHKPEKCEVIIMGGTFLSADQAYKEMFIRGVYYGLLEKKYPNKSLKELQKMLENAKYRMTGLTIETRPDWCGEPEVDEMLDYGATRVELGIQTLHEPILRKLKRGHGIKEIKKAIRVTKDSAFKIVGHIMLNLPYSNPQKDLESFRELFQNPNFRPDMLKIYPTTIVRGSKLYEMWKNGEYQPYSEEKVIETVAKMLKEVPRYVRVQRVQRDIPIWLVENYEYGNLREMAWDYMEKKGWGRRGIRNREVGHKIQKKGIKPREKDVQLLRTEYQASHGKELFLSYEDVKRDILLGFLRLRKPSPYAHRKEINEDTILVRELHVFGPLVPIDKKKREAWQHKGYGEKLMQKAEKITTNEFNAEKILVISGIGARNYYRKLGYQKEGPYMGKFL